MSHLTSLDVSQTGGVTLSGLSLLQQALAAMQQQASSTMDTAGISNKVLQVLTVGSIDSSISTTGSSVSDDSKRAAIDALSEYVVAIKF
jgi:hypothetical protein